MSTRSREHWATLSRRTALKAGAAGLAALFSLGRITPALADELSRLAQNQPMTGPRLAGILRAERTEWNVLLAQVGTERMEISGAVGDWSVKQLVAHLTWYEQGVLEGAQQVLGGRTFTRRRPAGVSLDEQNGQIAETSRNRSANEVLAEADEVFGRLLVLIEACPQEILNDPRVLGLPDDMVPWMGVANNSYAHYRQHEPELRAWLHAK
ncbi:MAG: DinB family protein [Ktedonobacterales bacterium]